MTESTPRRSPRSGDAGADVNREAAQLGAHHFALAGVEPRAHVQAEGRDGVADRAGAAHRARRAIEGGEEAVAGGVDLATAVTFELAADHAVVRLQVAPRPIAELAAVAVASTMSVNSTVASTRSGSEPRARR